MRVCVALPQWLSTLDLASISSLNNEAGIREGWCDMSVFYVFVRNREAVWYVSSEVFFFFCKLYTHFLQAITLFTPVTIYTADQNISHFSITFLK